MTDIETDARLLAQPIGFWASQTQLAVLAYVRGELAELGVTQPLWWVLSHTEAAGGMDRDALAAKLRGIVESDATIPEAVEDARGRGWLVQDDTGRLTLTGAGRAAHARIGEVAGGLRGVLHEGVSDEDYLVVVKSLRRIIANAGGHVRYPAR
ncbi:MarR family transcriptional regulator [Phytomonospora sp. NPDC050363]|uniref:MarR family transcriptional regulator n=1 Tax=Phytomonospora sp. NPDC050363 TaxID=3155642 RepID=UPI003403D8C7